MTASTPPVQLLPTDVAPLQRGLAAEHAAIYAYGIVGAHLDGAEQQAARDELAVHQARRDAVSELLRAARYTPVAALPAYAVPTPVTTAAGARKLAAAVEGRVAAVWSEIVALTSPTVRLVAAAALTDAALAELRWTGQTSAFPGGPGAGVATASPTPSPSR
ncbi:MAG: ferritin-like domain-containing protein [Actinomycetales bacterium]